MGKRARLFPVFRKPALLLFLCVLLLSIGVGQACAQGSRDICTIVISKVSSSWPKYDSSYNVEYKISFPVNGGQISGDGKEIYHFQVPVEFESADGSATKTESREAIYTFGVQGQFSGGDGGTLTGKVIPNQRILDTERDLSFTGTIWANGKGVIKINGNEIELKFSPFGECCNKDLNSYSKAIQEILRDELMNVATPYLHQKMVQVIERGMQVGYSLAERIVNAGKTMYQAARLRINRLAAGRFVLPPLSPDSAFLRKLNDLFEAARKARSAGPLDPLIDNITSNMDKCYAALKILDAASEGDYADAGFTAAATAVGAYSNLAGLALALGEAAKADWDGFCETNYESEFRRLYRRIYFEEGPLPSERRARASQQARLKDFMDECLEWLSAGGGHGAQLRKMLIDFAHYRLQLSKNRDDFQVIEAKGDKLVLASRADATVLAALFQAYEQVFFMDVEAERARKVSLKQYKADKKEILDIYTTLYEAERGKFGRVWPKAEYDKVFCDMYHRLEKAGKLKEAGK